MAYNVILPLHFVRLNFNDWAAVMHPLLQASGVRPAQALPVLAGRYAEEIQNQIINKGQFSDILNYLIIGEFATSDITIFFESSRDGLKYPNFSLEFVYILSRREAGVWGLVPALGVEVFSKTSGSLERDLEDAIRLEFTRKQRLVAIRNLISAIWFDAVELLSQDIQLRFPGLIELAERETPQQEQLLPKVAKQLAIDHRIVYGRKTLLEQLFRAVKGKFNRNILLVGPSGVGKTALVWELARQRNKRRIKGNIWETTASTLIKELTRDTGWQDNMVSMCSELAARDDFLFLRNLMELFEVGQYEGNSTSMAEFIRPYLSRGEINLIAECTEEELARIDLRSPNYTTFFQIIRLEPPRDQELENIIIRRIRDIGNVRNTTITKEAIRETIRLHRRFNPYAGFPGKPIRFLESITIKKSRLTVTRGEVINHFCEETGMPNFLVDPEIPMDPSEARTNFKKQLFGQDHAIESVVNILVAVKASLTRTGKPIASFLFVGPTGVGKTEMAKILADFTFGNRQRMVRFDMSEFSTLYDVTRLIGTSYYSEGLLTTAVRKDPFCLLLFDEIEKAHPSFNDLLLQILGEGRLTDSQGKLVNFCSTIIIMTSNIGAGLLQHNTIGWQKELDRKQLNSHFITAVQKYFKPELFNRIDEVIPFEPLSKVTIRRVVEREISALLQREGIRFRNIDLDIEEAVFFYLADTGYDDKYGARALQRAIRQKIIIPLAKQLNLLDYHDQIMIRLLMNNGQPEINIESDPLGLEILLEELEKINIADHTSALRRKFAKLIEGHSFVNLLSQLDIMDQEKKKTGVKFFKNRDRAEQYGHFLHTKEIAMRLKLEIDDHENTAGLQSMNLKGFNPSITETLKEWEKSFSDFKIQLFSVLNPHKNISHFAIYGRNPHKIYNLYQFLFEQRGIAVSGVALWFDRSHHNKEMPGQIDGNEAKRHYKIRTLAFTEEDFKREQEEEVMIGLELILRGAGVQLYFEREDGLQEWKDADDQKKEFLIRTSPEPLSTPKQIHRKEFYKSPPRAAVRRFVEPNFFRDTNWGIQREYKRGDFPTIILEQLNTRFEIALDQALK